LIVIIIYIYCIAKQCIRIAGNDPTNILLVCVLCLRYEIIVVLMIVMMEVVMLKIIIAITMMMLMFIMMKILIIMIIVDGLDG